MRVSIGAFALIRRCGPGGGEEWLANWNEGWRALNLVGGHKHDDESFRDCCAREVAEELGIVAGVDFRVAPEAERRLEYIAVSRRNGEKTAYTQDVFVVDLLTDAARGRIAADADNAWLSEREIRALRTADGRAVSPTVERVLIETCRLPKDEQYDLFLSYAHDDDADGFVAALADALQREHQEFTNEPLKIFFDRHDIRTADDWEHRILGGLKAARALLSVLSPTYFRRPWCLRELDTFVELEKARAWPGEALTPVYAVAVPDADPARTSEGEAALRRMLQKQYCDLLAWRPYGLDAFRNDEVRRRLRALNARLAERVQRVGAVVRSSAHGPRHNPNFVGREDELRRVREALMRQQVAAVTAVHGVAGAGKSALASEYAHAFGDLYPGGRFWLPSENYADLRDLLRLLEAPLGLTFTDEERKDRDAGYVRARTELERRPRSLLVLDNVNRPELLAPADLGFYRPDAERVHVLATMREEPRADPAATVEAIPLDRLSADEGRRLLQRNRDFGADEAEWHAARRIVAALEGHALSLEVVGVYVWQRNRTEPAFGYGVYLQWMEKKGLLAALEGAGKSAKVHLSLKNDAEKVVSELLEPMLKELAETPGILRALEYASLLPADWVVLPWLKELVGADFPDAVTRAEEWDEDPWSAVVARLRGLRLIAPTETAEIVKVHRVVQAVVCDRLRAARVDLQERLTAHALKRAEILRDGWVNRDARWEIEPLYQLTLHLFEYEASDAARLANWISSPMRDLGKLPEARRLLKMAVAIDEKRFEPDHPALAASYSNLALVELDLGKLPEARRLLKMAVAIKEKRFEPDHPTLATSYSNLAMVERDLGDLVEARRLLKMAVAIEEKRFEPDHPTLATSYSNLAMVEKGLGDLVEARRLLKMAVAIQEKRFEPDHPTLATSYSNLAMVERDLGDLVEARRLLKMALAIEEKRFEPDHPTLATSYSNLAMVERGLGDLAEARRLLKMAVAIQEKRFKPDHPTLAIRYSNLATVERDLGDLAEARRLLKMAVAIQEKRFEPDHPTLATSYSNLALVEQDLGDLAEARRLLKMAVAIQEKRFKPDHPTLAIRYSNLATVERDLGDLAEARRLLKMAVAIQEKRFEPDHPTLATSYSNLALVEQDLGDLVEARRLLKMALAIEEKRFEPDHPTLATSYSNLALVEQDLGDLVEARRLLKMAVAIQENRFEPDHPTLATSYSNLATVEQDLGDLVEARRLLKMAVAIQEKRFEPDHPTLATSYSNLATVERGLGDLVEARRLLKMALAIEEKRFEPDHPTLATSYSNLALVERGLGDLVEARRLLKMAVAIQEKRFEPDHPNLAIRYFNLACVEAADGAIDRAQLLARQSYGIFFKRLGAEHPHTRIVRQWLERNDPDFRLPHP